MFEVFGPSLHFCNQLNSKPRWVVQFLLVIFLGRYRKFPVERVVRWAGDLPQIHLTGGYPKAAERCDWNPATTHLDRRRLYDLHP